MAIDTLKHREPMLRSLKYKMYNTAIKKTHKFINKQVNRLCSVNFIFTGGSANVF